MSEGDGGAMWFFSRRGVAVCSGVVYVSWERVSKLTCFFSGHAFNFVTFLSPINVDGAVKFLLFGENPGQP